MPRRRWKTYKDGRDPVFRSSVSQFMTVIYSMEYEDELNGDVNGDVNSLKGIFERNLFDCT